MKLLFSYTGPLIRDSKGNYYSRTITDEVLSRYFKIADEVTIITRVKDIFDKEELKKYSKINSSNLNVIQCPNFASVKGVILERYTTKKIIKQAVEESDILIIRMPCIMGNMVVDIAKEKNKPYLLEVVACPWDAYWNHSLKGKVLAPFMYYMTKKRVENADYSVYVTNEFLQKRYPTKGENVGCSDVALLPLDDRVLERRLNKIRQIKKDKPIILGTTAAVNVRYKGQEYVIKAISKLNKEGYNFEYYLAGGGNTAYLKSIAEKYNVENKVKFLGTLPHDKVFEYLDNIDVYIQPSRQEGLPRALVEAMSRGCPSLGSTTGGIPELLNKQFIFNNGKVNEICNLLKKLDGKIMIEEAKRSFEKVREYDKEKLDKKRNKFYAEFMKNIK